MAISDDFRFIDSIDTQVRSLCICNKILHITGKKHVPKELLERMMQKWSDEQFLTSEKYRNHRGILTKKTKNGLKKTTAFKYYIIFLKELGFVVTIGDIIRNGKYGRLFNVINASDNGFSLSDSAKFFYLYFLFEKDGDAILTNLDYLFTCNNKATLKNIHSEFKSNLKKRLFIKQNTSSLKARIKISAKYRNIEANWEKQKIKEISISKFIVPPRLEWLADIGVLQEVQIKRQRGYSFTNSGIAFYHSLIKLESNLSEISQEWLFQKGVTEFSKVIYNTDKNLIKWKDLKEGDKLKYLSIWLEKAENVLDTDGAMRISILPAMLFLCINMVCKNHVVVNFNELFDFLKKEIKIKNKLYNLRTSSRINEGYINIKLAL